MIKSSSEIESLLARVAKGDREAFARVYHATHPKLYGVILRILRRRDVADEILQEVYVKLWDRAGDFTPGRASPITWMVTIARNRALDEVRRRQLQFSDDETAVMNVPDGQPSPAETLELNDEIKRLNACLDELDGQRGEAVRLAYLQGLSRQELAERYDQPLGTIKSWLYRSLKQLKDCLQS